MMARQRLLAQIAAAAVACAAADAKAAALCGRDVTSIQQLYGELTRAPAAKPVLNDSNFVAFADEPARTIWTFTKPAHPAASAVVCRRPVQVDGRVDVQLQASCGGPKQACDALVAAFQALPVRPQ